MKTPIVTLYRYLQNSNGTFGAVWINDWPVCYSYELPWKENKKAVSCVPCGEYDASLFQSPKHGLVYKLEGVPGRGDVEFHIGNDAEDTLGCPLVGQRHGKVWKTRRNPTYGVVNSRAGFHDFMFELGKVKKIKVKIVSVNPQTIK